MSSNITTPAPHSGISPAVAPSERARVFVVDESHPLPPELRPNIDHIITEDGQPVDNVYSEKQQRLLTEPLYSSWHPGRMFVAMSNVGLFFAIKQSPYVPDMMLSMDVKTPEDLAPKENRSYFVWEYGKPPEVVIEVVSNKIGGEDTEKLAGYARLGIAYYVVHDPFKMLGDSLLRVYQLVGARYELQPHEPRWLASIELGLTLWQGKYEDCQDLWLRWTDSTGKLIPTGAELAHQQTILAQQQTILAQQQTILAQQQTILAQEKTLLAEQQSLLAEQLKQQNEAMAAQLRRLGHTPDA